MTLFTKYQYRWSLKNRRKHLAYRDFLGNYSAHDAGFILIRSDFRQLLIQIFFQSCLRMEPDYFFSGLAIFKNHECGNTHNFKLFGNFLMLVHV